MGSKERVDLLADMVNQPRMMEAVLRSPVPIPVLTEALGMLWRAHVDATHPDAPKVAINRAAVEWAGQVLGQISAAVGAGSPPNAEAA
jgi:hypothetical protein